VFCVLFSVVLTVAVVMLFVYSLHVGSVGCVCVCHLL
jgi:hypothetical protein